jgi:ionotropic glutamate receptor
VVLGAGCTFALLIAIAEFLWNVKQVAIDEKVTLREAFQAELKFVLNFRITTKPIHKMLSESKMSLSRSQFDSDLRSLKKSPHNLDFDNGNNSMGGGSYKNRSLINIDKNA